MKALAKDPEDEINTKTKDVKRWKYAVKCPHITSIILISLVAIGTLRPMQKYDNFFGISNLLLLKQEQIHVTKNIGPIPGCNLFSGKWIYDNASYPLYEEEQCSFLGNRFPACKKNGREDFKYQQWRWQPHHCDTPRFNGSALLERLRGKKLIFVGDSLGRNQWESMICLTITQFPPPSLKSWKLETEGNFLNFHFYEYNATIAFYWEPFLVESDGDNAARHTPHNATIRIKSIENHGRHWIDADILVFDTFAWWVVGHWFTILWGSFEGRDSIYKTAEIKPRVYEMALNTWSDWLEMQINPSKTKMFFMSHSPFHYGPAVPKIYHCIGKKEPIGDDKYWQSCGSRDLMQVVESMIEKLEERGYRVDAHPGVIAKNESDCLHWCLPGVPDVWNQLLYAYIINS
ncbi:hypothetical protein ACS0TY_005904 [Phlomoides rotata]